MKTHLDKITSVTLHANLERDVELSDAVAPVLGNVVVVRALQEKSRYDSVELVNGRMAKVSKGDVIAGALGRRKALRGFVGDIPDQLRVGDRLHILNLGGVMGVVMSGHLDVGKPLLCEVLGSVKRGDGVVSINRDLGPAPDELPDVPLVLVAGTCMASGKTQAAATLVQQLTQRGLRVNGAKVTGVACLRDLLNMEDHGARRTRSFLDAGLPSTIGATDVAATARTLLADLATDKPDVIVVELGDGIIGHYGVEEIMRDKAIRARTKAQIMCANDLVGAWGAMELMRAWDIDVHVMSGPATDNDVGEAYAARELRVTAANAFRSPHKLGDIVEEAVS